jgi:NAD(P)-dependent dehydrogenase (short-subunit alcohol dehydrogenase family)
VASPPERLLVTGGASGIGRAIAEDGLARGWDVIVVDRDPAPVGTSILADLSDTGSTSTALAEMLSEGPVTGLVNNVGAVELPPTAVAGAPADRRIRRLSFGLLLTSETLAPSFP